jgi:hypothetical protein
MREAMKPAAIVSDQQLAALQARIEVNRETRTSIPSSVSMEDRSAAAFLFSIDLPRQTSDSDQNSERNILPGAGFHLRPVLAGIARGAASFG